jgi:hypothetical protein
VKRAAALLLALIAGCSTINEEHGPFTPDPVPDAGAPDVIPLAPTYEALYVHVFRTCRFACHTGSDAPGGFVIDETPDTMIDVLASGDECAKSGLDRIEPGDPAASVLYSKVLAKTEMTLPVCGGPMPDPGASSLQPLTQEQLDALAQWIEGLAP